MLNSHKKHKYRINKLLARQGFEKYRTESITNSVTSHLNKIQTSSMVTNDDFNLEQQQINYQHDLLQQYQQQHQQQQQQQYQVLQPIINQSNTLSYNPTFNNSLISTTNNLNIPRIGENINVWNDNSDDISIDEDEEEDENNEEDDSYSYEDDDIEEEEEEYINNSSTGSNRNEENDEVPKSIEHPSEIIKKVVQKLNFNDDEEQDTTENNLSGTYENKNEVLIELWKNHRVIGEDRGHFCERFANKSIFVNYSSQSLSSKLNKLVKRGKISPNDPATIEAHKIFGVTSISNITASMIKDYNGENFAPFKTVISDIETDVVDALFKLKAYKTSKFFSEEFGDKGFFKNRSTKSIKNIICMAKNKYEASTAGTVDENTYQGFNPMKNVKPLEYNDLVIKEEIQEKLNIDLTKIVPSKKSSKYKDWEIKIINHVFSKVNSSENFYTSKDICKAISSKGVFENRNLESMYDKFHSGALQPNEVKTYEWKEIMDVETIKKEIGIDLTKIKGSSNGSKLTKKEIKIARYIIQKFNSLTINQVTQIIAGTSIFKNRTAKSLQSRFYEIAKQSISYFSSEINRSNDSQPIMDIKIAMNDLRITEVAISKSNAPYSDKEELILQQLFKNSTKGTTIRDFINKFGNVGLFENRSKRSLSSTLHKLKARNKIEVLDEIKLIDYFNVDDINSIAMKDVLEYQFKNFAQPTGEYKKAEIELINHLWNLFLADSEEPSSKSIVKTEFADLLTSNGFFKNRNGLYTKILSLNLIESPLNQEFKLDETILMNAVKEKIDLNNFVCQPTKSDFSFKEQVILDLVFSFASNDITSITLANLICSSELKDKFFKNRPTESLCQKIQRMREHNLNDIFNVEQIENISIPMVNNLNSSQYKPRALSSNYSYNEMKLFISLYDHKDESMSTYDFLNALSGKGFYRNRDSDSLKNLMRKLMKDKDIKVIIDF
ncbi:uncharacterized protein KGF55_002491 [Candida pseudojiufengensis]|uniref:uncharacterized protein n=1 Tax=Candida pseudojiufengensis TaxID=497109 RepID=UPI002224B3A7|nr:uncharacterized protein KGF55_002491 [Candida pseudojiufengensis]KAI5963611.1 hypothetical protein KGF55_002491 [Candida pseudojiufengensis]